MRQIRYLDKPIDELAKGKAMEKILRQGHSPEVLKGMLDHLAQLREQGLDVIED